jgi:molybdenum cofactor cytidylyltransferase
MPLPGNQPRLFAVVPAAGNSRRMGCPKLLLPAGSTTVIARVLAILARPEIAATVVVVRPDDEPLRAAVAECGAIPLQPDEPPPEMRQSVEHALRYLERKFQPHPEEAWFLVPADHPQLDAGVIDRMISAWHASPGKILLPTYHGKRGHPTLFPFRLMSAIFRLPINEGLNMLLRLHSAEIEQIEVDSPGVVADLDTPDDYAHLQARLGER